MREPSFDHTADCSWVAAPVFLSEQSFLRSVTQISRLPADARVPTTDNWSGERRGLPTNASGEDAWIGTPDRSTHVSRRLFPAPPVRYARIPLGETPTAGSPAPT